MEVQNPGGQGGRVWDRHLINLARKAARERWGVPDEMKAECLYQAATILSDSTAGPRNQLAAAKFLLEADKVDQADDRFDWERQQKQGPEDTARDALSEAEAADREYDADRPQGEAPQPSEEMHG